MEPTAPFDYQAYLKSDEWKQTREEALEWACHRCQLCNSPDRLHVHHRTYERIGCEDLADLTVLCSGCHDRHHLHVPKLPGRFRR